MLTKDRKKRLGKDGYEEILKHPYFQDINVYEYVTYKIEPPFKPDLTKDFFNTEVDEFALNDTYLPKSKLNQIKKHENAFAGFTSSNIKN